MALQRAGVNIRRVKTMTVSYEIWVFEMHRAARSNLIMNIVNLALLLEKKTIYPSDISFT